MAARVVIERIVCGGQTGADRAALNWAISHGVPHGGWCPAGRMAEDGVIPARYQLTELPGGGYLQRTEANVRDSDATLIMSIAPGLTGGSRETLLFARWLGRPWLHLHTDMDWRSALRAWIDAHTISTLNVAGPRASEAAHIGSFTVEVLDALAGMAAIRCAGQQPGGLVLFRNVWTRRPLQAPRGDENWPARMYTARLVGKPCRHARSLDEICAPRPQYFVG